MLIYGAKLSNFETINEHIKTTQLLNPLLILYKAQCTTAPMYKAEFADTLNKNSIYENPQNRFAKYYLSLQQKIYN